MRNHLQQHSSKYLDYQKAVKANKEEQVSWNLI